MQEATQDDEQTDLIVEDLVNEMADQAWPERRNLVIKIVEIEQIALSLLEGETIQDGKLTVTLRENGIVRYAVAEALRRLEVDRAVCRDSAVVLSHSADDGHRQAAAEWFARHQGPQQASFIDLEDGLPRTLH